MLDLFSISTIENFGSRNESPPKINSLDRNEHESRKERQNLLARPIFPIAAKIDVFSFPHGDPPAGTSWPFLVCLFKAVTKSQSPLMAIIHFYLETKFHVTRSQMAKNLLDCSIIWIRRIFVFNFKSKYKLFNNITACFL